MDEDRRRRCRSDEDCISGLPDELLHGILLRLGSARAAARTTALSRRWRRVWPGLPELVLDSCPDAPPPPPASFLDTVDAALAAYSSSSLARLCIALPPAVDLVVPADRAAPWLRFAADRAAAELCLFVPPHFTAPPEPPEEDLDEEEEGDNHTAAWEELELPAWRGAKTVRLCLQDAWRLRPPAGVFASLTGLMILFGRADAGELETLVSMQCPCLRDLRLQLTLIEAADVSIHSDSLRSLWLCIWNSWRLVVVAPGLEKLSLHYALQVRVSAPKLEELAWRGRGTAYDPQHHEFDEDVGRRLRLLEMDMYSTVSSFAQRFDEAEELKLVISILWKEAGYDSFLNGTKKLPKCRTLSLNLLEWRNHSLAQAMLHLFRRCQSVEKVSIWLRCFDEDSKQSSCPSTCPCRLAENQRIDDINLSSLEVVEISSFTSSHEELDFLEQLSRCSATSLRKLVINYNKKRSRTPLETKEACQKIRSMYPPNVEVEFYVLRGGRQVRFDWRLVKNVK
ncbi:unnamed protein product [Urochloa decumbens]|uniref:F-box/LRR-repeat protein 15/At3g58940/PEG3-like LRR domain-containing protein n=1 Tax=Urochloa decumbens TaxID=240449 RepID=A0ABC9AQ26_9POAL